MTKEIINVLQIGSSNWKNQVSLPDNLEWFFLTNERVTSFLEAYSLQERFVRRNINIVLLTDDYYDDSIADLSNYIEPYSVLYSTAIAPDSVSQTVRTFFIKSMAYPVNMDDPEELVDLISHTFFSKQYGDKFQVKHLVVSSEFTGRVSYDGSAYVHLSGKFGKKFRQVANYAYNIPKDEKPLEFWPEFITNGNCEVQYHLQVIRLGSNDIIGDTTVSGSDLDRPFYLKNKMEGYLHISIFAKGEGELKLGPTHYRFSRYHFGKLLFGGEVHSDAKRQEFFSYFHPGDFTPPLNVYFSGYRTAEGFEGYWMLKDLGKPFLLIADPRLEGGAFYIGSKEYENALKQTIQDSLDFLEFDHSQLILSGLSMGTFGALYYGIDFAPHAIVVGKPLVNLGTLAKNEKYIRPGVFPTSLDLLKQFASDLTVESQELLDHYFWEKFKQADFSKTQLRIAYMKNDDYDRTAFKDLLEGSHLNGAKIVGKGWTGRHNDNSAAITQWFINQYRSIIAHDFSEKYYEG